ncbi:lysylphosphatidylglycerol synthase transmembrane domain-containing protein [Spirosoma sp. 209]|uniref:lysylphosphatidylglycerol synthase transmembrane domain-containing protein n=1 Tax=Spirosoma sp. 209 TaxID=1955701 RepID=UPI00098D1B26|nr:lysylphosphatidylglycerol synthase transmembrane domain-containing protein [Spirosoma sp. 209]
MKKAIVRQIIPIGLAIGLLWYVLDGISLTDLAAQFRQADSRWLALAGALIVGFYLLRAARWQLTLQALGYRPTLFRTAVALLAGAMASMIIPGAGELTRCGTLQRTDGIPLAQGIGSVVAERVIDILMLGVLIGLTLLLEFNRAGQYLLDLLGPSLTRFSIRTDTGLWVGLGVLTGLVAAGLVYWLARTPAIRQHRLTTRLLGVGRSVGQGFMGIRRLRQPGLFIGLTVLSYVLIGSVTYVLFLASDLTSALPPTAALTILTVSSLGGLAVPTQGGLGTYHFLVSRVLMLYGLNEPEGVIVATFIHAVQIGYSLLLSGISFLIVPILIQTRPQTNGLEG